MLEFTSWIWWNCETNRIFFPRALLQKCTSTSCSIGRSQLQWFGLTHTEGSPPACSPGRAAALFIFGSRRAVSSRSSETPNRPGTISQLLRCPETSSCDWQLPSLLLYNTLWFWPAGQPVAFAKTMFTVTSIHTFPSSSHSFKSPSFFFSFAQCINFGQMRLFNISTDLFTLSNNGTITLLELFDAFNVLCLSFSNDFK